jgi:hypothetical protein
VETAFVYLVESRIGRRGLRTRRDHWRAEAAYLTLAEAEAAGRASAHRYGRGWRVTRVESRGELARLLAVQVGPMPDVGL